MVIMYGRKVGDKTKTSSHCFENSPYSTLLEFSATKPDILD
jgi:hypothetical protein